MLIARLVAAAAVVCLADCGGGGSSSPPAPPQPDFSLSASTSSLTTSIGGTTGAVTVTVKSSNGFSGSVSVAITGLPAAAATNPAGPLIVGAGSSQSFTVLTSDSTPTGNATVTLTGTSGSLSHMTTVVLTTTPAVSTSQSGTLLYLEARANGHTARIGADTKWGGAIVDVTYDGNSIVNAHDTGREVQPAFYDGADQYPWPAINKNYGWDPVLGGDFYDTGSSVEAQQIGADSLYTRAVPLQWYPDSFGGGATVPVPSDMTVEQTITLAPGTNIAFQVHYRMTHNGTDTHYNTGQEFPAVYVNAGYGTLAYYAGSTPWTGAALTETAAPPSDQPGLSVFTPEQWAALVDSKGMGLAVYVPGEYARTGATAFPSTGSGPTGNTTIYMAPMTAFTFAPGSVIEGDVFLVPGDVGAARSAIYALHQGVPAADIFTPNATVDAPTPNATISGTSASVTGWAFDNIALDSVEVYVDGVFRGAATLGGSRPDVAAAYPQIAPGDSGWSYALDTTALSNGAHAIVVHVRDKAGNEGLLAPVSVTVSN